MLNSDNPSTVKEQIYIKEMLRRVIQIFIKLENKGGHSDNNTLLFSSELSSLTQNIVTRDN